MLPKQDRFPSQFTTEATGVEPAASVAEPNDLDLIAAAQQGDAPAYGLLVRRYQNRLCSSLSYVCGSFSDAQDATQEAFIRAYTKLSTYSGASGFYTWLYRIAMNAAISEMRKRKSRSLCEQSHSPREGLGREQTDSPDERLLRAERVELVRKALNSLGDEYRAILVLREIENCEYGEISTILQIPLGTVRSRLHRARLELRSRLAASN